jgi:ribosome modulation factor
VVESVERAQGRKARDVETAVASCPYESGTKRQDWIEGWYDADARIVASRGTAA